MYFDENIYVAWVQGGDVLEIIVSDAQLGSVFYTLAQREEWFEQLMRRNFPVVVAERGDVVVGSSGLQTH